MTNSTLYSLHQGEIQLFSRQHYTPAVGKLWALAQLWTVQHFLLGRATFITAACVVCKY